MRHRVLRNFIPRERHVVWWDVENVALRLDSKQEKWLSRHRIAVRGFMGKHYDNKLEDERVMRFPTQLKDQADHAISVWSGRWIQSMNNQGVPLSKLSTVVVTKDKFGDAWSTVLNQGGVKASRVTNFPDLKRFFIKQS
jgi:predicted AAA+ superfamily ATPase